MSLWGKVFCSRIRDVHPGESMHFFCLPGVIMWPCFSAVQITFLLSIVEKAVLIDVCTTAGLVGDTRSGVRTLPAPARLPPGPRVPQICPLFSRPSRVWQPAREIFLCR